MGKFPKLFYFCIRMVFLADLFSEGFEILELCDIVITFGQCGVSKQGLVLKMAEL